MWSTRDSLDSKDIFFRVLCTGPTENIGTERFFQKLTQTASFKHFLENLIFSIDAFDYFDA